MVLSWIGSRNNYSDLPKRLRRYIVSVSIAGPLLAVALLLVWGQAPKPNLWPAVLVLLALAGVAERFPLHLTHQTTLNVSTSVYVAMFLLLPPMIVSALALAAAATAQILRMRADAELDLAEPFFNIGQTSMYVGLSAILLTAVPSLGMPLFTYGGINLATAVQATIAMHLINTIFISAAAGLQMGVNAFRIWRRNLTMDLGSNLGMSLLGVCAAALGEGSALLIPALFLPAVLVHRTVGDSVRLRENLRTSLASFVDIIELRDPYTAGHSRRVASTARALALELGLTAEEADMIESAGHVHDIGKVAIDPAVLAKPGKLTDKEWMEMKRHPIYGAEVISRFAAYQDGSPLVRWHHEAWDGAGYPDGLRGDEIPLGARILAVADTFDALTSDRPYRDGMAIDRAREILAAGSGKQWDVRVIQSLFAILDNHPDRAPVYQHTSLVDDSVPARNARSPTAA